MKSGCLRRATLGCATLLLVPLLAALFAWQLFPKDFFAGLPERLLNRVLPEYRWRVDAARYAWPGVVTLQGLEATPPGLGESIRLDSLELLPDWQSILKTRQKQLAFTARLADGAVDGQIALAEEGGVQTMHVSAVLDAVDLSALPWAAKSLGRNLRGRLSGAITATLDAQAGALSKLRANLTARDGEIPLRNPVLGHERLPFAAVSARIEQQNGAWTLQNGALDSPLGKGSFAGTLTPARPLAATRIDITGTLQPGSELFAHVRDAPEFQALRLGLGGAGMQTTLSGTLADPALAFGPTSVAGRRN